MKFNWGTGILIFLILFLLACVVFIVFAMRQDVNLVHEDYYEQGVDYTNKMNVDARSIEFKDSVQTLIDDESLIIVFETALASRIDSVDVLLFRPSSSNLDVKLSIGRFENALLIPKTNLVQGRYILKLSWYSRGLEYEIDKTVFIE
jgi:hypothetical protein